MKDGGTKTYNRTQCMQKNLTTPIAESNHAPFCTLLSRLLRQASKCFLTDEKVVSQAEFTCVASYS